MEYLILNELETKPYLYNYYVRPTGLYEKTGLDKVPNFYEKVN
jgi:hypothetical protein